MARKVLIVSEGNMTEKIIGDELEDLQREVGGYIGTTYFGEKLEEQKISLIFNEDGKQVGLPPTIALVDEGEVIDVITGNVIICSDDNTSFGSVNEFQERFIRDELKPVTFVAYGNKGFILNIDE